MQIVLASSNEHKVKEINEIAQDFYTKTGLNKSIEFILPPSSFNPIENGMTFEENSYIKAKTAWEISKTWSLADDSGLCIEVLNGAPGIYSARYAETPQKRIDRVLKEMEHATNRSACFECAMTLINPQGEIAFACKGICKGSIINEQKGTNGFGYDPVFLPDGYNQTIAELEENEKNKISHRSKALNMVLEYLIKKA